MINLRYHIVSLTAVFLAIGIGLTLGSTFLDRATVDNLNGQLENLETRLGDREDQINELQAALDDDRSLQGALDDQATGLLAGRLRPVPVVVLSSQGVDEGEIDAAVQALLLAGADVQGRWRLTDRFLLNSEAAVADLAAAIDEQTDDPARLRRTAIATIGRELRIRQEAGVGGGTDGDTGGDTTSTTVAGDDAETTTTSADTTSSTTLPDAGADQSEGTSTTSEPGVGPEGSTPADTLPVVSALADAGFVSFEPVPGGADGAVFPDGTRLIIVGGSPDVPDDVVLAPLVTRLTLGATDPVPVVVTSAMDGDGDVADIVSVVRDDDRLRTLVATVGNLEHFQNWAALVLALSDLDDKVVGHYGLGEGATRLLPPMQVP